MAIAHLYADDGAHGSNQVVIAHELLHTLGATDKYDRATGQPLVPEGLGDPGQSPRYPQQFGEIMAGRVAVSARARGDSRTAWTPCWSGRSPRAKSGGRSEPRTTPRPMLDCRGLAVRVPGRELVRGLEACFRPGTMVAVLGRNGAGKSSLLHVLAGIASARRGRSAARRASLAPVAASRTRPARWGCSRRRAKTRSRARRWIRRWSDVTRTSTSGSGKPSADRAVARDCLAAMDLAGLEARDVTTLSGGERRRLAIATVLAQDPQVFLLDEPIQQLDPQHQLEVLRRFRALADAGRSVVLSLHDPGLAARFADQALLLFGDGRWRTARRTRCSTRRRSAGSTASR